MNETADTWSVNSLQCRLIALYQHLVLPSVCQWKAFLAPSKQGYGFRIPPVKIQMDPLGVSFISVQSIAGISIPPLIISWEGGEEGRQAGLLFPLLKENCQQSNLPQLKSQYISWSLAHGGAQLLSEAVNEWETGEVQMHGNANCSKNDSLLHFFLTPVKSHSSKLPLLYSRLLLSLYTDTEKYN